jgi:hypothetical protein
MTTLTPETAPSREQANHGDTPVAVVASTPKASARERSKKRGAAMTEAAVFIPLFAIMFTGMGFVAHLYVGKMNAMRFARQYTWQYAVQNCEGAKPGRDPADKADANATAGSGTTTVDASQEEPIDGHGTTGLDQPNGDGDVAALSADNPELTQKGANTGSTSKNSIKYSSADWSPSAKVESTSKMMCNEPRTKTGILDVMGRAIKLVKF